MSTKYRNAKNWILNKNQKQNRREPRKIYIQIEKAHKSDYDAFRVDWANGKVEKNVFKSLFFFEKQKMSVWKAASMHCRVLTLCKV